jgi:hypothetical protein
MFRVKNRFFSQSKNMAIVNNNNYLKRKYILVTWFKLHTIIGLNTGFYEIIYV